MAPIMKESNMGPTTDEERRIRSYLQGQGAKLTSSALIEKVQAAMEEVRTAAVSVPASRFQDRPTAGEWSANEVMAHVVTTGARICDSIAQILEGAVAQSAVPVSGAEARTLAISVSAAAPGAPAGAVAPAASGAPAGSVAPTASGVPASSVAPTGSVAAIVDAIESGAPERSADEWWARLVRDRTALFERVRRADPTAHLDRTIDHPMFGPLNWRETLLFLRLHDLDHAGQLQKIATALA
jgi:DinB superfamily